jgi:hypothetical protein
MGTSRWSDAVPPLKNSRREAFARALAEGCSEYEAQKRANYKPDRGNAARLTANDSVMTRVAELQGAAAEKTVVTVESILDDLARALKGAEKGENWNAMVSAAVASARVSGLMIDRHLVRAQHEIKVEEMGDFELFEAQVRSLISMCEAFGLDPEACSFSEFIGCMIDEEEASHEEPPPKYRQMPPLPNSAGGNRAPDYRKLPKPEKVLTRGEAEKLRRTPRTNGVGTNGRQR